MATPPRISYSYGLKLPGAEQWASINVNASLSIDVEEDETPEAAMDKARKFVQSEIEKDFDDIQRIRASGRSGLPREETKDEDFEEPRPKKGKAKSRG